MTASRGVMAAASATSLREINAIDVEKFPAENVF